jgi:benzil reductase ((S)-benzoin forming)
MRAELPRFAYIVTGTTRGIGRALADDILHRGHMLYTISRAPDMQTPGRINYMCDLRDTHAISKTMPRIIQDMAPTVRDGVVLVNNAGALDPIGFMENHTPGQIADALCVNLTAPSVLMSLFINQTHTWQCSRRIINITSGAAFNPYAGWSLYCAAKAGLNMLTRCAALEQSTHPNGASVVAVAPGVVNTDMQRLIRQTKESDFPARSKFMNLKMDGNLTDPARVAALLLDLDAGGSFQSGGIYDLRNAGWREGKPYIEEMT